MHPNGRCFHVPDFMECARGTVEDSTAYAEGIPPALRLAFRLLKVSLPAAVSLREIVLGSASITGMPSGRSGVNIPCLRNPVSEGMKFLGCDSVSALIRTPAA